MKGFHFISKSKVIILDMMPLALALGIGVGSCLECLTAVLHADLKLCSLFSLCICFTVAIRLLRSWRSSLYLTVPVGP